MVILQLWIPERGNVERGERKRERGKVKGRGWRVKVAANQRRGRHRPLSSTVSHRRNKETRRGGKLISSCASHFLLDSNNEVYSSSVYRSCDYFPSFFIFINIFNYRNEFSLSRDKSILNNIIFCIVRNNGIRIE